MKARHNQPKSTPRGSFRCTPVECSATSVVDGRRTIRFAASVLPGVLAVLPVRKTAFRAQKSMVRDAKGGCMCPMPYEFHRSSPGFSSRYESW
jgi:hypothetical protein